MSEDKILKVLNPSRLVDKDNLYRITSVRDNTMDRQQVLARHPQYASLSYYSHRGSRYKDFTSFLKKFRCAKCHVYGMMKAISLDQKQPNMVQSLICANCKYVAPLDTPVDRTNVGKGSSGIDKRPTLVGKATKFKSPISEGEKLGISRALRKNLPEHLRKYRSAKSHLLETPGQINSKQDLFRTVNRHLKNSGFPVAGTHSTIKSVYDVEDADFNEVMSGKGLVRETVDYTDKQIRERMLGLSFLY